MLGKKLNSQVLGRSLLWLVAHGTAPASAGASPEPAGRVYANGKLAEESDQ